MSPPLLPTSAAVEPDATRMESPSITTWFGRIWYQNVAFSNAIAGPRPGSPPGSYADPTSGSMSGKLSLSEKTRDAEPAARTRLVRQLVSAVYALVTALK